MRLQRVGRRNDPSYRIVVTDKRTGPKSNKHVAILGAYDPKRNHTQLDAKAATSWPAKGAQTSDTVHNILVAQKVVDARKINVLPHKSPTVTTHEEATKAGAEVAVEVNKTDHVSAPTAADQPSSIATRSKTNAGATETKT